MWMYKAKRQLKTKIIRKRIFFLTTLSVLNTDLNKGVHQLEQTYHRCFKKSLH